MEPMEIIGMVVGIFVLTWILTMATVIIVEKFTK